MIELSSEQLKRLQEHELDLLKEVHRVCTLADIHYNIIAGTLLGAVRHQGFIPWDDDVDIALMRKDYEKFRDACEIHLNHEEFYFQDHRNTTGYRWGYGKLRKKNTLFLREFQEHMPYEQGIFLDVFPLDYVPEGELGKQIHKFQCFCVRKVLWSEVGRFAHPVKWKRAWFSFLNRFYGDRIFKIYDKLVARSQKETKWVKCLTFPAPTGKFGYLAEWYENSAPILFEGVEVSGIADFDGYLSFKFGDYMSLPPKEEQKTHPVTDIKL